MGQYVSLLDRRDILVGRVRLFVLVAHSVIFVEAKDSAARLLLFVL